MFEKYICPLQELSKKNDEEEDLGYAEEFDEEKKLMKQFQYIQTSQGVLPLVTGNVASLSFNLWIAHTNFKMTFDLKDFINSIEGIESFELISPYRWRFSVARMFDENLVKKIIEDKVTTYVRNLFIENEYNISVEKIDIIKSELSKKYKFWAILIKKNYYDVVHGDTMEQVVKDFNLKKEKYEYSIRSWD